jgi:hypothetical protein
MVESIKYNCDSTKHCVFYADGAKKINDAPASTFHGNIKSFIGNTIAECNKRMQENVGKYLKCLYYSEYITNPKDFTFQYRYSEIDDNGEFWPHPSRWSDDLYPILPSNK